VRGLPGLAVNATGRKERKLADAPVDKFRDWQENTNSIFCEDHSLVGDSKWKSGSISHRNHGREANTRGEESERITPALLRSASGELLPS
jgi:hypothetical protein